jgi:hypothetical protein
MALAPALFAPEPDAAGRRPAEWEILLLIAAILQGARPADTDPRALDALFFGGLVAMLANAPASPIAGRDPAEIVAATQGVGPERLLDFSLRIGPEGEGYGANPDGLTLATRQPCESPTRTQG